MSITAINEAFEKVFNQKPSTIAKAPGRLEILGNHTDYNEGYVLSVAVDREIWFGVAPSGTNDCTVYSAQFDEKKSFSLENLESKTKGDWSNYVKGTILELRKRGIEVKPFNAVMHSTVPLSAGMSSSAALETSVAYALAKKANPQVSWQDWAKIGQGCENNYIGANTGLMDQFSSIMGKKDQLVYSDFRELTVKNVALPKGLKLVVANSLIKHDLTEEYNERRMSCENAAKELGVKALRDASLDLLEKNKNKLNQLFYKRALHVVGENTRVQQGVKALADNNISYFGSLMSESHDSSISNFENSCEELDVLIETGKSIEGFIGARLSGGGFGGISVHLVHGESADAYCDKLKKKYESVTGKKTDVMICSIGDGAEIIL